MPPPSPPAPPAPPVAPAPALLPLIVEPTTFSVPTLKTPPPLPPSPPAPPVASMPVESPPRTTSAPDVAADRRADDVQRSGVIDAPAASPRPPTGANPARRPARSGKCGVGGRDHVRERQVAVIANAATNTVRPPVSVTPLTLTVPPGSCSDVGLESAWVGWCRSENSDGVAGVAGWEAGACL